MITLHHVPQSRSMRVLWLLEELGVEYRLVARPFDKSLRAEEYLAVHPVGRIPSVEIDGEVLWESGAIIEILCERLPERGLGRAPGEIDRPDWLIWLHFAETVSQHVAALTQQHIVLYRDDMRSPLLMRIEAKRLEKCYAAIEGRLSTPVENRDYLLTSGFSAADIAVGQAVYMARHFARLDRFPETERWYARITERPAFRSALPAPGEGLYARDFYEAWE
jgi:glutathione S-transferase